MISLDPCGKISWEEYTLHRREVYIQSEGGALLWHWQIIFKYLPTWFAWLSTEQALKLAPSSLFLHILTGCKSGKYKAAHRGFCVSLCLYIVGRFITGCLLKWSLWETHIHRQPGLVSTDSLTFLVFRQAAVPLSQLLCQCPVSPSGKAYTHLDLIR